MNKILIKIFSVVVCIALLLVPTTVMAEEGVDYNINYEINLTEGTKNYPIDSTVPYTVYILYPSAVGEHTITSDDCTMGIVSYLDMWVQFEPTENNVNLNTITWSCSDLNQAIMIAVKSDLSEVTINVSRIDPNASETIEWTIYENKVKPESFTMPDFVDVNAFADGCINFKDDTVEVATLGDDGYYHLNDNNGPILFANLNDSYMSLYEMSSYGKVSAIYYDDEGNLSEKVDYTNAFNEYIAALPTNAQGTITSFYYPLTDDLIEMFKEVGATHEWYSGDNPWIYASDDAWLYACYFDKDVTTMDESSNDNTGDDNGNNDNIDDGNGSTESDILGDISGDGQINGKDAVALMQYVNGWNVEFDTQLADVYVDGTINIKDYIVLVRYLNGWDITLG